jgi:hypothetical protein
MGLRSLPAPETQWRSRRVLHQDAHRFAPKNLHHLDTLRRYDACQHASCTPARPRDCEVIVEKHTCVASICSSLCTKGLALSRRSQACSRHSARWHALCFIVGNQPYHRAVRILSHWLAAFGPPGPAPMFIRTEFSCLQPP